MKTIITTLIIIVLAIGGYFLFFKDSPKEVENTSTNTPSGNTDAKPEPVKDLSRTVIGKSAGGHDIVAYHFYPTTTTATAAKEILFVGGIHGGYEWNTSLVAFEIMDHLKANPNVIPSNVKVTVIPVLNPDGLNTTVGTTTRFAASQVPQSEEKQIAGRYNANTVDLNRNFDCDWQREGKWQSKTVSGGSAAFSEPEAKAIRDYVNKNKPASVIVWYSAAGGVFSSNCHGEVLPQTKALTETFAKASGYPAYKEFDFYAITGDMTNWLAKIGTPAVSVLLTNHKDTELSKNIKGVNAVLQSYAE